jgi:hypothetical protein
LRLCLQVRALIAAFERRYAEAAQVIGWVNSDYTRSGEIREPTEQLIYGLLFNQLEANLTGDDIGVWFAEGARWSEAHAADYALRRIVPPRTSTL